MNSSKSSNSLKSVWKENAPHAFSFFCPQCRTARRIHLDPNPIKPIRFFQVAVGSLFFTLLTWHWFEWKGIVSFIPFWVLFEGVYRLIVRSVMRCNSCGFDAYLYLRDVKLARGAMEKFWAARTKKTEPLAKDLA